MEYWLSAVYIGLECYAFMIGMEIFLPRRWKGYRHWLAFAAWAAAMYVVANFLPVVAGGFQAVRSLVAFLGGSILLYSTKQPLSYLALSLIYFPVLYLSTLMTNAIAAQVLEVEVYKLQYAVVPSVITALLSRILCIFLLSIIRHFHGSFLGRPIRWPYLVLALIFPSTSFVVLLTFLSILKSNTTDSGFVIPCSILLAVADVSVLILLDQIAASERERQKAMMLEQKLQLQGESFTALGDAYTRQRKITHDFRAHLDLLFSLLKGGETKEAMAYLQQIRAQQTSRILLVNSRNPILDALLNQKAQIAQQKGIDICFEVNDLSSLSLNPADITVILSNLLDNAIEACAECVDKQIEVKTLLEDSFLVSVRNTSQPVRIINNQIATTKPNPMLHGFGLENVKDLLAKYHAEYVMLYDNGWFQFTAEIPTMLDS